MIQLLFYLFPILVIFAAVSDVMSMTIPNWLNGCILLLFLALALVIGLQPADIGLRMAMMGAFLLGGIVMFALGWLGGGDAKLLAALIPWFAMQEIMEFVVYTALFGGLLAFSMLQLRKLSLAGYFQSSPKWLTHLMAKDGRMPYGVAIAAGAMVVYSGKDNLWANVLLHGQQVLAG